MDGDSGSRLPRWDSLDGVRAMAVAFVVATHFGLHATQGQIGVDVFFVLSGFLITSLLLAERDRSQRIGLKNFWQRRARRLFPALGCAVALALLASLVGAESVGHATLAGLPYVLFYVGNWVMALGTTSHGLGFLSHSWSLAVEEQFYLLWPLVGVLWLCRTPNRRRAAQMVGALAVIGSLYFFVALARWGPPRAIFGTDTHAMGLLAGSALSLWVRQHGHVKAIEPRSARRLGVAGIVAATFLVIAAFAIPFDLVIVPATLAATVLVACLVLSPRGALTAVFSLGIMRWLGRRSYGIYLYHYPLALLFVAGHALHGFRFALTTTLCIAASVLLAAASYRWVETPFLRKNAGRNSSAPAVQLAPVVS
ncbi:MAG TPA: acyltransferase [Acidimicrobiales bacterium]